jgi:LmbE family N-acetylglucosaminyl deacetylase
MKPRVVLAIGAHPDDIDFSAGGTLALFASQGAQIHYLQLTDGGSGSSDPTAKCSTVIKARRQEQLDACKIIGGHSVEFLDYRDGCLENSMKVKTDIVKTIRYLKPDVVIGLDPTMVYTADLGLINHPDHRAAGQATLDAIYPLARDRLSLPKLIKAGLEPHKVTTVLLVNFTQQNFYVDITDVFARKLEALLAHKSQFPDHKAITNTVTDFAKKGGKQANCKYAEGFMRIKLAS